MKWSVMLLLMLFGFLVLFASPAEATRNDGYRYGLGLQWVDPVAFGPSGTVDLGDMPLSLQGVLGINDFPSPVARVRLAFWSNQHVDGYAYGALGLRTKDEGPDDESETELFGGVGAGLDWDWRSLDNNLPPVSWSLELGLNGDDVSMGFGAHYSFNL